MLDLNSPEYHLEHLQELDDSLSLDNDGSPTEEKT